MDNQAFRHVVSFISAIAGIGLILASVGAVVVLAMSGASNDIFIVPFLIAVVGFAGGCAVLVTGTRRWWDRRGRR